MPRPKNNPKLTRLSSLPPREGSECHKWRLGQRRVMSRFQRLLEMLPAGTFPVQHVSPSWGAWTGHGVLWGTRQVLVPRGHIAQGFTDQTCPLNFSLNKLQTRLYMPGESTQWKAVRHSPLPARVLLPAAAQDKAKISMLGAWAAKGTPAPAPMILSLSSLKPQGAEALECHFCPFLSTQGHVGNSLQSAISDSKCIGFSSMLGKSWDANHSNVFKNSLQQNNLESLLLSWRQQLPLWLKIELHRAPRKE